MISQDDIRRAADLIRKGRLVAFPTETVYGLGANALDAEAVARIFAVKRRPPTSPLIVHVASIDMARQLASEWPARAEALAKRFWPGPLTLVAPKHASIPDVVTAGLATVGLRMPSHPVALELIRESGRPIAAPSANRFMQLSPTSAEHVLASLGDSVDMVLDGGPTEVGIESTVLSFASEQPELLRPGMLSRAEIEAVIGPVADGQAPIEGSHPAPGMHSRHYSPRTPLMIVFGAALPQTGRGAYVGFGECDAKAARVVTMPREPAAYAGVLYETLHKLDREGFDWLAVECPPELPQWAAILDRLRRAAGV